MSLPDYHNFSEALTYHASSQPDVAAFCYLGDGEQVTEELTYGQLHQIAETWSRNILSRITAGDCVALAFSPGLDFVKAFYACLYAGVVAVPINPPDNERAWPRFGGVLANAGAKLLLSTTPRLMTSLADHQPLLPTNTLIQNVADWPVDLQGDVALNEWRLPQIDIDQLAFIQYTSGTTGAPKGVQISHRNILHNQQYIHRQLLNNQVIRCASWLPFYHDMGLIGGILQPVYAGGFSVMMPPISFLTKPIRWLRALSDFKCNSSGAPDFGYRHCVDRVRDADLEGLDLSLWKTAVSGAERVNASTIKSFVDRFSASGFSERVFSPCYGLAEATLLATGSAVGQSIIYSADDQVGCGDISDVEIAIVPTEHSASADDGEVWLRGDSVSVGYWQCPEENARSFNQIHPKTGECGWYRTGDLGFIEQGQLFISGRMKELIIIRGRNLYPQDIEFSARHANDCLHNRHGAAFSTRAPSGEEQVVLLQEIDRRSEKKVVIEDIAADVRQAVASHLSLQIDHLIFVRQGTIPVTSSGKVQRKLANELYQRDQLTIV